ncbi:conserved protein of unknown function [Shewanella benthica]|uniref:Uncharacterized protein n=1 Tax=Shewanella benthica TaxID=43661 RepID=A0A330M7K1_9GAMM|nr:ead/Ea22-like family protein [Shewanella benthica]SQH76970.1 conserved protein of unknown function [Shewanella benthica]
MSQSIIPPAFLLEMSQQLNTQNNRITADPIFMVCYDKWLTSSNDRGDKTIFLVIDDEHYEYAEFSEVVSHMAEYHEEWAATRCSDDEEDELSESLTEDNFEFVTLPEGVTIERVEMQKNMEVVKACLTEADAKAFIARKQHDYAPLYTYAFSMCFTPQMIELRKWIMSLTKSEVAS